MTEPPDESDWYETNAREVAPSYEAIDPASLHSWFADLRPAAPGLVLDVGAGTGRNAAWLCRLGYDVVACEPSAAMRAEGEHRHAAAGLRWVVDRLPELSARHGLGLSFDLILLSSMWQHVAPAERGRALRKLLGPLPSGGVMAVSPRHGPSEARQSIHPVSLAELDGLARDLGAVVVRAVELPDQLGRAGVSWIGVVLRLPDDGTGALPLLRRVQ